ncbi:sulfite exporter TauE/SafE family protein [Halalkalicoccus subterraneus]|uniref:sulfite exporter TauE/SafE family protein n=1 Tax=Halalkalicoccus subterraneus TaxID=2675002 RepID=UPI000EFBA2A3|nr:sulfite exporter TauE/SafE family protein [Halalkalicoccus subterraneus]
MSPELAVLLAVIALFAGIGITAIGPGGVFVTIALFALAPLSSPEVAGTASATFVATGLLGSLVYFQSGEFAQGHAREIAIVLSATSVLGALAGSRLNFLLPEAVFGYLLSAFVATVGVVIVYRERVGLKPSNRIDAVPAQQRRIMIGTIGLGVGVLGGLLGVGGPVVAVPVLVMLGVPMLVAVAVAQVQSIFISAFAAASYATAGAVSVPVALLVGVPQLIGVVAGWKVAHLVDPGRLRVVLGIVLIVVAPTLLL